ncbi:MAG: dihydropteroate synthase [Candidatus Acidiferrales bacterium]|jgi:dihydropteroate synthase
MLRRKRYRLKLPTKTLELGQRTLVMGVLNVTPDSFSDGGAFLEAERAVEHALAMERDGADMVDIGGESTRPGSEGVSVEEELGRVLPVIEGLRGQLGIPISIDTRKAEVAEAAIAAGAEIINDISGLKCDPRIAKVAAQRRVALVLMHMRGEPKTMQKGPFARNVMRDVIAGLRASARKAMQAGVLRNQIVLDPGIGFGKSFAQNYEILAQLAELGKLGFPLLVGTSRKGFLGTALASEGEPLPPEERIWGTAATVAASILGGTHIVRVHDVKEMVQVARVADRAVAVKKKRKGP